MSAEAMTLAAHIDQRARKIADSAAQSDIECFCVCVESEEQPTRHWYDTRQIVLGSDIPDDNRFIAESVEYLELRGLLLRREGAPHVVSFRQAQQQGAASA